MRADLIAVLSAVMWAVDSILVRLGARTSNVIAAAFLSYCVTALILWSYVLLYLPLELLGSQATIYFVFSGCLQPLLARILYYMGMTRLGVSRAGPLRGTDPLFALILATIFLDEQPSSLVYVGTVLIVASAWLISSRVGGESEWKLWHVIYPLGAAFFGAVSQNLRKGGLLILSNPVLAAAVSTSTSLLLFAVFLLLTGRMRLARTNQASFPFFGSAALVSCAAQLLNFSALNLGNVSTMVPLFNTTPLFAVLFSTLFLRELETVTLKVAVGALLMVAGVIIISSR